MKEVMQVVLNPYDIKGMRKLMKDHGNVTHAFMGRNNEGEVQMISVYSDRVIIKTYQDNGWIQTLTVYQDGEMEEDFEREQD